MVVDTDIYLIRGFKLPLIQVFEKNWIDPSIMDEDNWQYLNMDEEYDLIINKYVLNDDLKILLEDGWRPYILSSTQDKCNPANSYLFIYLQKQDINTDNEYDTGEIKPMEIIKIDNFDKIVKLGLNSQGLKQYWIVKHSW